MLKINLSQAFHWLCFLYASGCFQSIWCSYTIHTHILQASLQYPGGNFQWMNKQNWETIRYRKGTSMELDWRLHISHIPCHAYYDLLLNHLCRMMIVCEMWISVVTMVLIRNIGGKNDEKWNFFWYNRFCSIYIRDDGLYENMLSIQGFWEKLPTLFPRSNKCLVIY